MRQRVTMHQRGSPVCSERQIRLNHVVGFLLVARFVHGECKVTVEAGCLVRFVMNACWGRRLQRQ